MTVLWKNTLNKIYTFFHVICLNITLASAAKKSPKLQQVAEIFAC